MWIAAGEATIFMIQFIFLSICWSLVVGRRSAIQFQFNEYLIWASVCLAVNIYGHRMCSFCPLARRLSPSIYLNAERSITLLFYCHYYALFLLR